jgi:hypothetical protein
MKIKEHLHDAFKNPFANLLAIANLALLAFANHPLLFRHDAYTILICDLNAPAVIGSVILTGKLGSFALLPPLVYLQWIFIGWLAKTLARYYRPEAV